MLKAELLLLQLQKAADSVLRHPYVRHWEQLSQPQRAPCRAGAAHPGAPARQGIRSRELAWAQMSPERKQLAPWATSLKYHPCGRAICPHRSCQGSAHMAISLPDSCFGSAASLASGELYFLFVLETLLKLPLNYFSEFFL